MRYACVLLGFSLGLLFQGCTVQKRSHLPGWHVERVTQRIGHRTAAMSSEEPQVSDAVVNLEAEPAEEVLVVAVVPALLPSLEASGSLDFGALEPDLQKLDWRLSSHESPHVNDAVSEEEVEPVPKNYGGMGRALWRVLLGVVAAVLGANGIWFVQWGLGWWDSVGWSRFGMSYTPEGSLAVLLLGVVLLEVAWRALLVAFPKLRAWEPLWSDLKRDPQAREARREALKEHLPPVEERRSVLGRVFMGLLAIPLAIGCIPAFAMAFGWGLHYFTVPFALLGLGLIWLSLRALLAAFPKLRARINMWASQDAKHKRLAKREAREATPPSSSQPWWLPSRPVLVIAAAYVIVAALTGKIG